ERGVAMTSARDFASLTGKGVTGEVDGTAVALGNRALMDALGIDVGALAARAEELRRDGQTVMFVGIASPGSAGARSNAAGVGEWSDGALAGLAAVADPIKPSTPEAIAALHAAGIRIVMLTGDSATTASAVARKLGIDDLRAEVLPEDKAGEVKRLQAQGR